MRARRQTKRAGLSRYIILSDLHQKNDGATCFCAHGGAHHHEQVPRPGVAGAVFVTNGGSEGSIRALDARQSAPAFRVISP